MARALAAVLLGLVAVSAARAQPDADFSFPDDPAYVVLEYAQTHEMLEPDPTPLLRIYGDGRVRVHQPAYRIDAGDYELRLSRDELQRLIASLADRNLPRANVAELAREKRGIEERRAALAIPDLRQRMVWANLQLDAERFPSLSELVDLAAAESELRALLERPDLRRLD